MKMSTKKKKKSNIAFCKMLWLKGEKKGESVNERKEKVTSTFAKFCGRKNNNDDERGGKKFNRKTNADSVRLERIEKGMKYSTEKLTLPLTIQKGFLLKKKDYQYINQRCCYETSAVEKARKE